MKNTTLKLLFFFFLATISLASTASPNLCELNFINNALEADTHLCKKYRWSSRRISKANWSDYFRCRKNLTEFSSSNISAQTLCMNKDESYWFASSRFNRCLQSLKTHVHGSQVYDKCRNSQQAELYLSTAFNKCTERFSLSLNNSQSSFKLCHDDNIRQVFQNQNFSSCLNKFENEFSKDNAIKICNKSLHQLNYISSSSFDNCLANSNGLKPKDAYLLCLSEDSMTKLLDPNTKSCLIEGFKSASLDFYLLKHLEIHSSNEKKKRSEFHYLFKDCRSKNSFFTYQNPHNTSNSFLTYYRDYNFHTDTRFAHNFLLGGLSALRFNTDESTLTFLSDDRGIYAPARLIKYDYKFSPSGDFSLEENSIIKLNDSNNEKLQMDPEGFDVLENGNYIISSELDDLEGDDFISIYTRDGIKKATIPLHEDYKPKSITQKKCKTKTNYFFNSRTKTCKVYTTEKGFQPNKSLESLSLSPDKNFLFTANEQALHQDKRFKKSWGFTKKIVDHVRIAKFHKAQDENFVEESQFYYQLEAEVDNGLVDILALDEHRLLTLERSWNKSKKKIVSRIFFIDLRSAQNILSLSHYKAKPVYKKLLLDLSDIEHQFSPGFRLLENFEGMDFGPTLPNGKQSLVLVTDNNFKSYQRTLLLFLEINIQNILSQNILETK